MRMTGDQNTHDPLPLDRMLRGIPLPSHSWRCHLALQDCPVQPAREQCAGERSKPE
jgi:hypothetical protein